MLEALGVPVPADAAAAARLFERCGFTFLFAPVFHPAMKAIAPVRRALGVRTVFNILGPLTNPASPPFGVIGAWDVATARLMAETLAGMPIGRVFVVHGHDGWDEPTPTGPFVLFDVRRGRVTRRRRDPHRYGLPRCRPEDLAGDDAPRNAEALEAVLAGTDRGAHRDALLLGAGLLLEVSGRVRTLRQGIDRARRALESGEGARLLARLREAAGP